MESQIEKRNKAGKGIVISFCALLAVYLGISIFFMNHFYFGSAINCINVSGETVDQVDEKISSEMETYTLTLEGRGGVNEEIKGADIGLKYNSNGDSKIQSLKDNQKSFGWISGIFNRKNSAISEIVTYNEGLLKKSFDNLSCLDSNNVIESKNPSFEYTDAGYEIVDEVYGNKINKDVLYNKVVDAILNGETKINLESIDCYENPQYTSDSPEVVHAKELLDNYTTSQITYTIGDKKEVLDGSTIHNWLKVDENFGIVFDEGKIKSYVDTLANTYNTVGKTRDFVTSLGTTKKISGGSYGWMIDSSEEVKDLIEIIKNGQSITKEPIYKQTAISHEGNDIGNTYVEVNMADQHLWFYKNGSLIVEGDVVTGNVSNGCGTPAGIYKLEYKQKDATLKGDNYSTPVSFWMPFNGGIGIHDANWRSVFGGSIYMTGGSHGCVNAPYHLANTIFNSIDEGTPVICYY